MDGARTKKSRTDFFNNLRTLVAFHSADSVSLKFRFRLPAPPVSRLAAASAAVDFRALGNYLAHARVSTDRIGRQGEEERCHARRERRTLRHHTRRARRDFTKAETYSANRTRTPH